MIKFCLRNANLLWRTKCQFGQISKINSKYPYKFGGIETTNRLHDHSAIVKRMFGQDVFTGFEQAYLAILSALKDKDKSFLQVNL